MIIIGIDPGTRIVGYGVISKKNSTISPIDYGCVRLPPKEKLSDRYYIIFQAISELLERHKPEAVAIETQYVHKNVQSAIKLGMARGVVIIAAKQLGIPVFEYAPTKAKLAVVGNGRASKNQVQGMVQLLLNLPHLPEPEDAADALALAICHVHAAETSQKLGIEF